VIPSIRSQIKTLNHGVMGIKHVVHPQKIKIEKIDNTYIEPMRERVDDLHNRVELISEKIKEYCNYTTTLIKLINESSISEDRLNLIKNTVYTVNDYLFNLLSTIDKAEIDMKKVISRCQKLVDIRDRLEKQLSKLELL
jgi:hypothetical protein